MVRFLMAIGLPASGKDTFYEQQLTSKHRLRKDSYIHISSDSIRAELGNINDQTQNDKVFNIMYKRTVDELNNGNNVYYNATNLSQKRRIHLLNSLKAKLGNSVEYNCVFISTLYEECLRRNMKRDRQVPEYVMEHMLKSFMPPHECEGWNNIYIYMTDFKETPLDEMLQNSLTISHDNPHHSFTIGQHMQVAARLYEEKCNYAKKMKNPNIHFNKSLYEAILYHDISKPICKTFITPKGYKTEIAHYYGHECASAYFYATTILPTHKSDGAIKMNYDYRKEMNDGLTTANLIVHHMDHFKGDKYLAKVAALYSDDFMEKLSTLHAYDLAAH